MATPPVKPRESRNDVIAKVAIENGLATEEQIAEARERQAEVGRGKQGKSVPLEWALLDLEIIDERKARSLYRSYVYYKTRREDKLFAKIAAQSKLATPDQIRECLKEQKIAYKKERRLVRLGKLLRQKGYLPDAAAKKVYEAIEGMKKKEEEDLKPQDREPLDLLVLLEDEGGEERDESGRKAKTARGAGEAYEEPIMLDVPASVLLVDDEPAGGINLELSKGLELTPEEAEEGGDEEETEKPPAAKAKAAPARPASKAASKESGPTTIRPSSRPWEKYKKGDSGKSEKGGKSPARGSKPPSGPAKKK